MAHAPSKSLEHNALRDKLPTITNGLNTYMGTGSGLSFCFIYSSFLDKERI